MPRARENTRGRAYTLTYTHTHTYTDIHTRTRTVSENTKRRVRVYRISEFAVYLGAFAVARGKTQASAALVGRMRRWEGGNRRSGFTPVVSGCTEKRSAAREEMGKRGCAHAGLEEESVKEIPWSMLMNEDRSRFSLSLSFSLVSLSVIKLKISSHRR